MPDPHEREAEAPLGLAHEQLTKHHVSSIEEKRGTAQPLRFIEKTLEGRRSQRRADPRPDPYYARGLEESWTRKKTKRAIAVRRRTV